MDESREAFNIQYNYLIETKDRELFPNPDYTELENHRR